MAIVSNIRLFTKGDIISVNGLAKEGLALVDESACSGVSKPVWIDGEPGNLEVWSGALIVDGWLKVESETFKHQLQASRFSNNTDTDRKPVNGPTEPPRCQTWRCRNLPLRVCLTAALGAPMSGVLAYVLSHSVKVALIIAVVAFLAILLDPGLKDN